MEARNILSTDIKADGVWEVVETGGIIFILYLFFDYIKLILHPIRRISQILKWNRKIFFGIFFLESTGLSFPIR